MTGRYVPPALRNKAAAEVKGAKSETTNTLTTSDLGIDELFDHFWPIDSEEAARAHYHTQSRGTLHDSKAHPGQLTYVILYQDANPLWNSQNIIFAKSNLEYLPDHSGKEAACDGGSSTEGKDAVVVPTGHNHAGEEFEKSDHDNKRAIAVFECSTRGYGGSYSFQGWYQVATITRYEPESQELTEMLEKKWSRYDRKGNTISSKLRDATRWRESLSLTWAEIKFVRDTVADAEAGPLRIKKQSKTGSAQGVNELLAELRLNERSKP